MELEKLIQINKFSKLHDGNKIIFCKTDYLIEEFEHIKTLNNNVILVSGNSDLPITDTFIDIMPTNIKKWYGQNILCFHEKIIPIPLGIENRYDCNRFGHGHGYFDKVETKENLLTNILDKKPSKKIYANFQVNTNYDHRQKVKEICNNSHHIDWSEPNLTLDGFFNTIIDYEMVVCPAGNGVDTHRLWEVLYSGRIPITIKTGDYKIYDLYSNFPIIVLNSIEELKNSYLIDEKFDQIKNSNYNYNMLDTDFWCDKILNTNT